MPVFVPHETTSIIDLGDKGASSGLVSGPLLTPRSERNIKLTYHLF